MRQVTATSHFIMSKKSIFLSCVLLFSTMMGSASAAPQTYGPIKPGQGLWSIASKTRPERSVSHHQMMLALLRANPDAFSVPCNLNSLKSGAILIIPDLAAIQSLSKAEAVKEFERQTQAWRKNRKGIVCPAPEPKPKTAPEVDTKETVPAPATEESDSAQETIQIAPALSEEKPVAKTPLEQAETKTETEKTQIAAQAPASTEIAPALEKEKSVTEIAAEEAQTSPAPQAQAESTDDDKQQPAQAEEADAEKAEVAQAPASTEMLPATGKEKSVTETESEQAETQLEAQEAPPAEIAATETAAKLTDDDKKQQPVQVEETTAQADTDGSTRTPAAIAETTEPAAPSSPLTIWLPVVSLLFFLLLWLVWLTRSRFAPVTQEAPAAAPEKNQATPEPIQKLPDPLDFIFAEELTEEQGRVVGTQKNKFSAKEKENDAALEALLEQSLGQTASPSSKNKQFSARQAKLDFSSEELKQLGTGKAVNERFLDDFFASAEPKQKKA